MSLTAGIKRALAPDSEVLRGGVTSRRGWTQWEELHCSKEWGCICKEVKGQINTVGRAVQDTPMKNTETCFPGSQAKRL